MIAEKMKILYLEGRELREQKRPAIKKKPNIFDFKLCMSHVLETSMTHMTLTIKNFADPQ